MASLMWYIYNSGSQQATITVNYTEKTYANYSIITVDSIKYYNSYTSDTDTGGATVYWTGLTLEIIGDFGSHTVVNEMSFSGSKNVYNTIAINASTPKIPTGSSINFVLSGTLTPNSWNGVNRQPLTIGVSEGSSPTTQNITAHSHNWSSSVTKQPTCTEEGIMAYFCSSCETTYTETIEMLGHVWDDGVITKNPTYETTGIRTHTCSECNGTKEEVEDKLPATIYIDGDNGLEGYGAYIDNSYDWDVYAVYIDDGDRFIAYC